MRRSAIKPKKPRRRRCEVCREWFIPPAPFVGFCTVDCGVALIEIKRRRAYYKETRERKAAWLDTNVDHWKKRATFSCNRFIRERDRFDPCISCGATEAKQFDAGHYVPGGRGSAVRWNSDNIHKQCCTCNDGNKRSGNLIGYRPRLVEKIGLEAVEELERIGHTTKRWTVEELKAIVADYDKRFADLTRERAFA